MRRSRKMLKRPARRYWKKRSTRKIESIRYVSRRYINNITATTGVDVQNMWNFQLGSLPQSSELTSLYKEYKIIKVAFRWRLYKSTGTAAANTFPVIFHAIDERGSGAPAGPTDVMAYNGCRVTVLSDDRPVSRWFSFKPAVADAVYRGAFSGYALARNQWLSTSYADVQHYAVVSSATQLTTGINVAMDVRLTVALRGVA